MRSAVLAGLVMLAGCQQKTEQAAAESAATALASDVPVELKGGLSDPPVPTPKPIPATPPLPPTLPGDLTKKPGAVSANDLIRSKQFQAFGTEPFWSLYVLPGKLRYVSPENLDGTTFPASVVTQGQTSRYIGTLEGKPLTLLIEPGKCSDGMSDTVYPYKAEFKWGDQTQQGCARLK
jgi:uncharacterized membrane protein